MFLVRWAFGSHMLIMSIVHRSIAVLVRKDIKIDACLSANVGHVLRRRRHPLRALPRKDMLEIHGVDLFESAALAFNNEEVDDDSSHKVASSKDIAISVNWMLE